MCLIIREGQQPLTAEKDITVYKSVKASYFEENTVYSAHQHHKYKLGELNKTEITVGMKLCAYDSIEVERKNEYLEEGIGTKVIRGVEKGFHSAFSVERLLACGDRDRAEIVVECIIPKESLYYIGIDEELCVSNAIIINKIISKEEFIINIKN